MSRVALWAVRVLRKFPHSRRFDRHLDDCAAVAVLNLAFPERPPLRLAHVMRAVALPDLQPSPVDMEPERFQLTVITNEVFGSGKAIRSTNAGLLKEKLVDATPELQ